MSNESAEDDVVKAISTLMSVLKPLDDAARVHVLEFVIKRLGISLTAVPTEPIHKSVTSDVNSVPQTPPAPTLAGAVDIRSFAAEKSPKTVNQKVAVLAYYLAHLAPVSERRDYLVSDDISTYFIQAGFELPTAQPSMTLTNAKNAGYLNALDRGQYKLNAVGHNLVAHKLPGRETGQNKRKTMQRSAKRKNRIKARK